MFVDVYIWIYSLFMCVGSAQIYQLLDYSDVQVSQVHETS